ncbi:MAG: T9SS type A sorting domain-containing protein [Rhodothermales bacterium]
MKSFLRMVFVVVVARGLSAPTARAQNCEQALGEAFLDVNNVRARILNNGSLFYRGEPHVYEVPKGSGSNAIFASGIWLGGFVGNETAPRVAASTYGPWEFWAGPLDENGNPPADCGIFDRVYKVNKTDIQNYEASGATTPALTGWPTGLGAPTLAAPGNGVDDDEDGEIDEEGELIKFDISVPLASRASRVIDLAAGERPAILGDQSIWWVMNDRGNTHERSSSSPIGVEVHGLAFAFNQAGAIGDMTFYKFNIFYKGSEPLNRAYLGIFSDPDLGDFADDYVGSDSTLGLGYVYNADNEDISGEGYGTPAPAAGYDFFQGPIVPSVGDTALVSGRKIPDFKNLGMTTFAFYNNGGTVIGDPASAEDFYNYMQGRWRDGRVFTYGANGRDETGGGSTIPTRFMFSGDPVTGTGWTEFNPDPFTNSVPPISPGDRRFAMATGPFTINPGDEQEIIFGVVFARGTDNLNSVAKLRQVDAAAQSAFDVNFDLPVPPNAPNVTVTALDGEVVLEWTNPSNSNNYLDSYAEFNPLAVVEPGSPDEAKTYFFEGYDIIQYDDVADQTGKLIATYDVANGVTRVIDGLEGEPTEITAFGTDSGVQNFHRITNLTNYKTYSFGVQAYAYNEGSVPKVFRSPVTRFEVIPTRGEDALSETAVTAAQSVAEPDILADRAGVGEGRVWVDVVNPGRVQNATYTVEFYSIEVPDKVDGRVAEEENVVDPAVGTPAVAKTSAATATTFDIKRNGTVIFDGSATGEPAPQREKLTVIDGLQFSVVGPELGIKGFAAVSNNAGPIDPPDMAAFAFNSSGFPILEGNVTPEGSYPSNDRPTEGVQQALSAAKWGFHAGGASSINFGSTSDGTTFLGRAVRNDNLDRVSFYDWEMRFTQACADGINGVIEETDCLAWRAFDDGAIVEVPFQLWRVGVGTLTDPSDDVRLIPGICEEACGAGTDSLVYDLGGDHPISGGDNDPFTDWIYWYLPEDGGATPGEQGYQDFFFGTADTGGEVFARTVLVNFNGGTLPDVNAPLPESGTTFRLYTYKPSQPGDTFTLSTAGFEVAAATQAQKEADLETIGITPNPYKGASIYERSQLIDEVRITNLPQEATIRIFTLHGALIRTLRKNSPERYLSWDLTTDNALPIASGMYLVHVEVPGVGEHTIKFAVVKKRVQLNVF